MPSWSRVPPNLHSEALRLYRSCRDDGIWIADVLTWRIYGQQRRWRLWSRSSFVLMALFCPTLTQSATFLSSSSLAKILFQSCDLDCGSDLPTDQEGSDPGTRVHAHRRESGKSSAQCQARRQSRDFSISCRSCARKEFTRCEKTYPIKLTEGDTLSEESLGVNLIGVEKVFEGRVYDTICEQDLKAKTSTNEYMPHSHPCHPQSFSATTLSV